MQSLNCRVSGRVQGVYFRAWTQQQARDIGVSGWVRNVPDGTVEVLAQGSDDQLQALQSVLHQGPPAGRVDDLQCTTVDHEQLEGFEIRY